MHLSALYSVYRVERVLWHSASDRALILQEVTSCLGEGLCIPHLSQRSRLNGRRYFHASVVYADSLYLFGGYSGQDRLNDLYQFRFDIHAWSAASRGRRMAVAGWAPETTWGKLRSVLDCWVERS